MPSDDRRVHLDSQYLELQVFVSYLLWVLG